MEDIYHKAKVQIEYYFSDKNLENDMFFNNLLTSNNETKSIPIEVILQCNNIKALNIKEEDIIAALQKSEKIEISVDSKSLIRINKEIPSFLGRKRTKTIEEPKKIHEIETKEPTIIFLISNKDKAIKRTDLNKKLKEVLDKYEILYSRFGYQKGHVAVFCQKSETEEDIIEPFEFEIGDTKFNGRLANEDELKDFWLNHGSHFEYCLGVSQSNQNKGKKDKNILASPVTLGEETFNDIGKIRSRARNIFYSCPTEVNDFEVTNEKDKAFIIGLFKYFKDEINDQYKVKIEKVSPKTYGKSFYLYDRDNKREVVSYLNACIKLVVANRKNK